MTSLSALKIFLKQFGRRIRTLIMKIAKCRDIYDILNGVKKIKDSLNLFIFE